MTPQNTFSPPPVPDRPPALQTQRCTLSNGMPVCVTSGGMQDLVQVTCMVQAGNRFQTQPLSAGLAASMLSEGTTAHSAAQIAETLDFYGANFSVEITDDTASVTLMALRRHLPALLPLYAEMLFEPVFPQQQFDLVLERYRQHYLIGLQRNQTVARRLFLEALYGREHMYGRGVEADDFEALQRQHVADFHRSAYVPGRMQMFVSGRVQPEDLTLIDRCLGGISRQISGMTDSKAVFRPAAGHAIRCKGPQEVQASLRIGGAVCAPGTADHTALQLMNVVLGGYFGARLMQNLRVEKGLTYGIHSLVVPMQQSCHLLIVSDVRGDAADEAVAEIRREIDRLQQEPVPEEELLQAKRFAAGDLLRNFDGPFMQDALRMMLALYGLPDDYFATYYDRLTDCPASEVMAVAQRHLRQEDLYEVVVGGQYDENGSNN
ncbi:MAG: insulinase family protein [Bacteroidales bacterium]|nr:insulinase family protein [Bacteroidales bacterium]